MTDNLLKYKKRICPEWYEDGPVKVFTKEEIDEWTKTNYDSVYVHIKAQQGLSKQDIMFLDDLKQMQAETLYNEIMEGSDERGSNDSNA